MSVGLLLVAPIGTLAAHVGVLAVLAIAIVLAAVCRPTTPWAKTAKAMILTSCIALVIADAIFQFGSPLSGSIYWSAVQLASAVLLPVSVVLVAIGWRKKERIAVVNFALGAAVAAGACLLLVS
jgi:hypothetical protein